jgi:transporter family-2 protein
MTGVLFCILAGAAMSFQGVINTRLGEKIGLYESNVFVQGTAFLLSLIALWLLGKGRLGELVKMPWYLWMGGVLGLVITMTVMMGIKELSPTVAIAAILIAQLLAAALIDAFGLIGTEKAPFTWNKYVGMALLVGGVLLFKWKN